MHIIALWFLTRIYLFLCKILNSNCDLALTLGVMIWTRYLEPSPYKFFFMHVFVYSGLLDKMIVLQYDHIFYFPIILYVPLERGMFLHLLKAKEIGSVDLRWLFDASSWLLSESKCFVSISVYA